MGSVYEAAGHVGSVYEAAGYVGSLATGLGALPESAWLFLNICGSAWPLAGIWRTWATPPALATERLIDLLADTAGRVWVRTLNDLWLLSPGSPSFEHHSVLPPHPLRAG